MTKHTKRLLALFLPGLTICGAIDAIEGSITLLDEWPSVLSIATAVVWAMAGYDDLRMGTQRRIPIRLASEGLTHRYGWFRAVTRRVLLPCGSVVGWLVPLSMLAAAISYITGILVRAAAIGGLLLLAMMFVFLDLRTPRDDFAFLTFAQIVILVTNPGGLADLVGAVRSVG